MEKVSVECCAVLPHLAIQEKVCVCSSCINILDLQLGVHGRAAQHSVERKCKHPHRCSTCSSCGTRSLYSSQFGAAWLFQLRVLRAGRQAMEHQDIQTLRKELKALQRQKRRADAAQRRQHITPNIDLQMRAVLVLLLSGCAELAAKWAQHEQHKRPWHTFGAHLAVSAALVVAWAGQWAAHALLVDAVHDLQHPWRAAADIFLMESLLADRIQQMSASGQTMSSACAWESYLRYWSYRPQTPAQQAWLNMLDSTPRKRTKYLWRFRRRWGLSSGAPIVRPGLSMTLLRERACMPTQLIMSIV